MDWGWVPVVATFFLGLCSSIGLEWAKAIFQRRVSRADRREDFQRQTMLDLQVSLRQTIHAMDALLHQIGREKAAGKTEDDEVGPEVLAANGELIKAMDSVGMLYPRVDDDAIQLDTSNLLDLIGDILKDEKTAPELEAFRQEVSQQFRIVNQGVGRKLRHL